MIGAWYNSRFFYDLVLLGQVMAGIILKTCPKQFFIFYMENNIYRPISNCTMNLILFRTPAFLCQGLK
jgi:hypothetical protein